MLNWLFENLGYFKIHPLGTRGAFFQAIHQVFAEAVKSGPSSWQIDISISRVAVNSLLKCIFTVTLGQMKCKFLSFVVSGISAVVSRFEAVIANTNILHQDNKTTPPAGVYVSYKSISAKSTAGSKSCFTTLSLRGAGTAAKVQASWAGCSPSTGRTARTRTFMGAHWFDAI